MMALTVRLVDLEERMLEALLTAAAKDEPVQAAALVAGRWQSAGPQGERVGPYVRRPVSRAPAAGPDDIEAVRGHARAFARTVASMAPASRAEILEKAS